MSNKRIHNCKNCQANTGWTSDTDYSGDTPVAGWECNNCGCWEAKRVTTFTASSRPGYRTPSQKRALAGIRHHIESGLNSNPNYGDTITKFEVTSGNWGDLWVSVQTEMVGLPETNLLRVLDHKYWHFHIGRSGKVVAHGYPDSYKQFKGKKVFNLFTVK